MINTTNNQTNLSLQQGPQTYYTQQGQVTYGTSFGELVNASQGDDYVDAGQGNDSVYGGAGSDQLLGGEGHDLVDGGSGNDSVYGGAGNDWVYGGEGHDIVSGDAGDDYVSGGAGNDWIYGGEGSDWLDAGTGSNYINGGAGVDLAQLSGNFDQYNITTSANGNSFTFTDKQTGEVNQIDNVEYLQFNNGRIDSQSLNNYLLTNPQQPTTNANTGYDVEMNPNFYLSTADQSKLNTYVGDVAQPQDRGYYISDTNNDFKVSAGDEVFVTDFQNSTQVLGQLSQANVDDLNIDSGRVFITGENNRVQELLGIQLGQTNYAPTVVDANLDGKLSTGDQIIADFYNQANDYVLRNLSAADIDFLAGN